ncbi:MAG: hypothetical protein M1343_08310 [Chloroflexi bacterium]|nr:hypothetical protein [Chloroflexota bacterium]
MPGKVPSEVAREREMRAWEMRQKYFTHREIAAVLGVTHQAVTAMLHRMAKRYLAKSDQLIETEKFTQLERLERIAQEAELAWERSKLDAEKIVTIMGRQIVKKDGTMINLPDEVRTERVAQAGDPRFMEQLRGALADVRKIWGIDAPSKTELTGNKEKPVVIKTVVAEIPAGLAEVNNV